MLIRDKRSSLFWQGKKFSSVGTRSDSGHDGHAGSDVGGVGQLDAVLGEGAADGAHAEGHQEHGAA